MNTTACYKLYTFSGQSQMGVYYKPVVHHILRLNLILYIYTSFKYSALPYFNIIYIIFFIDFPSNYIHFCIFYIIIF